MKTFHKINRKLRNNQFVRDASLLLSVKGVKQTVFHTKTDCFAIENSLFWVHTSTPFSVKNLERMRKNIRMDIQ